jgi:hypothetical protein
MPYARNPGGRPVPGLLAFRLTIALMNLGGCDRAIQIRGKARGHHREGRPVTDSGVWRAVKIKKSTAAIQVSGQV